MCRRYRLKATPKQLEAAYAVQAGEDWPDEAVFTPGHPVPVVLTSRKTGGRELHALQWGLVPHWAGDPEMGKKLYNARAETIMDKPSFRDSFFHRRCLIPASSFFEWQAESKKLVEVFPSQDGLLAFAGIWDRWQSPDGKVLASCSIITTEASSVTAEIHHRMPAILNESAFNEWLDPDYPASLLHALLMPSDKVRIQGEAAQRSPEETPEELLL